MKSSNLRSIALLATISFFLIAASTSCKSISWNYVGHEVPEVSQIPLKTGGPHKGIWESEDITIQYQYETGTQRFEISGLIDFSDNLKKFSTMDYFYLWIHFVAADSRIIGDKEISPQVYFYEIAETPFKKTIVLPPDAKSFVFSYSGFAGDGKNTSGGKDDGGVNWNFWKTPDG